MQQAPFHAALALILCAVPGLARNPGDLPKPGFNVYSKQQDIEIGKEAAARVLQQYQQVQNRDLQAYVKKIGERLAKTPTASGSGFPFSFTLLNYKEVNAFALPGGPTFMFTGLINASGSEAELAGVLAHEISHVALRHGTHQASKANIIARPALLIGALNSLTLLGRLINVGLGLGLNGVFLKNSREAEAEADALGTHIMSEAGYDPVALAQFFEKLEAQGGPGVPEFLSDHPNLNIHYLPPYHPKLNYQERLWHMLRYEETTNTYYETMMHLEAAVFSRSQRWNPLKVKRICQLI